MTRETEVLLLALDFYSSNRKGTAGGEECKALADKIRKESLSLTTTPV